MSERTILRFETAERVFHWVYFAAFAILAVTGFTLLLPWSPFTVGEAGQTSRLLHRIFGVLLIVAPAVTLLASRRELAADVRRAFTWTPEDLRSLRILLLRAYWTGDTTGLPPQERFTAGQKLNIAAQTVLFLVLAATGLVIWFGRALLPQGLMQAAIALHALAAVAATAFVIVHVYMVTTLPATRDAIGAMFTGRMSEDLARSHHPKWYADVARRTTAQR